MMKIEDALKLIDFKEIDKEIEEREKTGKGIREISLAFKMEEEIRKLWDLKYKLQREKFLNGKD